MKKNLRFLTVILLAALCLLFAGCAEQAAEPDGSAQDLLNLNDGADEVPADDGSTTQQMRATPPKKISPPSPEPTPAAHRAQNGAILRSMTTAAGRSTEPTPHAPARLSTRRSMKCTTPTTTPTIPAASSTGTNPAKFTWRLRLLCPHQRASNEDAGWRRRVCRLRGYR